MLVGHAAICEGCRLTCTLLLLPAAATCRANAVCRQRPAAAVRAVLPWQHACSQLAQPTACQRRSRPLTRRLRCMPANAPALPPCCCPAPPPPPVLPCTCSSLTAPYFTYLAGINSTVRQAAAQRQSGRARDTPAAATSCPAAAAAATLLPVQVKDEFGRSWLGNQLEAQGQQETRCWNSDVHVVRITDSCPCRQVRGAHAARATRGRTCSTCNTCAHATTPAHARARLLAWCAAYRCCLRLRLASHRAARCGGSTGAAAACNTLICHSGFFSRWHTRCAPARQLPACASPLVLPGCCLCKHPLLPQIRSRTAHMHCAQVNGLMMLEYKPVQCPADLAVGKAGKQQLWWWWCCPVPAAAAASCSASAACLLPPLLHACSASTHLPCPHAHSLLRPACPCAWLHAPAGWPGCRCRGHGAVAAAAAILTRLCRPHRHLQQQGHHRWLELDALLI